MLTNKLILGTVQMGLAYGINNSAGKISFESSCDILKTAFNIGITTLDTAEAYGNAHEVIGAFHQMNPSSTFSIITKIPHDFGVSSIVAKVEQYITDLQVDSIEVLMFHSFDSYMNNQDGLASLMELKNRGIIKHIGVSVYTNAQIDALLYDEAITVVQLPFNLLDNAHLRGTHLQKLKDQGKIIHTRSAFLQGLFFMDKTSQNKIYQQLAPEIAEINKISISADKSISALALSYCLNQPHIDQVLIGVDSVSQLIENEQSAKSGISLEMIDQINAITVKNPDLLNPSLWK
ncbi:MAG: hypothetical protein CFE24_02815 [Flavobacterium sp. BFFFF2]|nr:MAG: hypothetical protein CFE24_02815 [Flavobacterium sp. BFFFF2]